MLELRTQDLFLLNLKICVFLHFHTSVDHIKHTTKQCWLLRLECGVSGMRKHQLCYYPTFSVFNGP